jgi:hypothetical protein
VGFNNNVRHKDRIFHIQTEDSGVLRPHINTHLFVDGGRIIKSMRTDYSAELGATDLAGVVRQLMKQQHKAMFLALRAGTLDPIIEQLVNDTTPEPLPRGVELRADVSDPPVALLHEGNTPEPWRRSLTPVPPPPVSAIGRRILTPLPPPLRAPLPQPPAARPHPVLPPPVPAVDVPRAHTGSPYLYAAGLPVGEGPPPLSSDVAAVPPPQRPPNSGARRVGRPTALSDVTPTAQSIFGVPPSVREHSLDNAIQSYLSEAAPEDPAAK